MSQTPQDPDVYMSGPLSAPPDEKVEYLKTEVYNSVYSLCNDMGLSCYCPHRSETKPSNPIAHGEVWDIDFDKVTRSDVIVAYVGLPSLGVGSEIEMARAANNQIILISEYQNQDTLSRLVLGNPGVKSTRFFDEGEFGSVESEIRTDLFEIFSKKNLNRAAFRDEWGKDTLTEMQQRLSDSVQGPARGRGEPMSVDDWIEEANGGSDDSEPGDQSTLF